ncbi:MAG: hypothetical protein A3A44_03505 [Candidatus Sungbacteria bacterium RIFCSPLOWO2_01_FULL_60_25]|uniref:Uncharacterized protein n=1 Tax=Candidatus Sungbacteria bacterium RIFCSPLOWO2_01_FULL_60_25 TaxID=1802281 RepID=A0A1G2LCI1_9BACT|nr:MAG: hypothetical protein A3A44_03505 [Candidatus Sungbacteria bacterium RIFCSPLOWO2_01_FULL_60_25]
MERVPGSIARILESAVTGAVWPVAGFVRGGVDTRVGDSPEEAVQLAFARSGMSGETQDGYRGLHLAMLITLSHWTGAWRANGWRTGGVRVSIVT